MAVLDARERWALDRLDRPAGGIAENGLPSPDACEENLEGGRGGHLGHGEGVLHGQGLRGVGREQFQDKSLLLQPSGGDDGGRQQRAIFSGGGEHRGDERPHGAVFELAQRLAEGCLQRAVVLADKHRAEIGGGGEFPAAAMPAAESKAATRVAGLAAEGRAPGERGAARDVALLLEGRAR